MIYHQREAVKTHFASGWFQNYGNVQKGRLTGGMDMGGYYMNKFVLWIDVRTTKKVKLNGI